MARRDVAATADEDVERAGTPADETGKSVSVLQRRASRQSRLFREDETRSAIAGALRENAELDGYWELEMWERIKAMQALAWQSEQNVYAYEKETGITFPDCDLLSDPRVKELQAIT